MLYKTFIITILFGIVSVNLSKKEKICIIGGGCLASTPLEFL